MARHFLYISLLMLCGLSNTTHAESSVTFTLPSGASIRIVEDAFANARFKTEGCDGRQPKCLINGHVPFGTDFDLPKTYVKRIEARFRGTTYLLNSTDMYNAWGSRPLQYFGAVRYFGGKCTSTKDCQFRGLFSDGAGTFVAEWRIVEGKAIRTVLTDTNDIVHLFMEHIDPPEYE